MASVWLLPVLISLGADGGAPAIALEFKDSATFEGRAVSQYRAIEFRDTPVRPLSGAFKPTPGALYGLIPVGPKPETALAVVWCPKASGGPELWLDANGDGRFSADERHVIPGRDLEIAAMITVQLQPQPKGSSGPFCFGGPPSAMGCGTRSAGSPKARWLLAERSIVSCSSMEMLMAASTRSARTASGST